jgi:hypothetical protein
MWKGREQRKRRKGREERGGREGRGKRILEGTFKL